MQSAFGRKADHTGVPALDAPRIVGGLGHILIIPLSYFWIYGGLGEQFVDLIGLPSQPLGADRARLLFALDCYYAVRWAFGIVTMNSTLDLGTSFGVTTVHALLHCLLYSTMGMWADSSVPVDLTNVDYLGAAMVLVAGVLQHGAELQRYLFKRDPHNKGKLHTSGLFAYARFINHTGHTMRDVGAMCLARTWLFSGVSLVGASYQLLVVSMFDTIKHMKKKYGKQYDAYEKQTPYLLVPGVY